MKTLKCQIYLYLWYIYINFPFIDDKTAQRTRFSRASHSFRSGGVRMDPWLCLTLKHFPLPKGGGESGLPRAWVSSAPGFGAETTNYPIFFHSCLSLSSFIFIVPKPRASFMLLIFEDRLFQFHRWTQTSQPVLLNHLASSPRFPEPCGKGWL